METLDAPVDSELTLLGKILKFWDDLNKTMDKQSPLYNISQVGFNNYCFTKCDEIKLPEKYMNIVIACWVCTLSPTMPDKLKFLILTNYLNNEKENTICPDYRPLN